jgi:beta-glucosidase/6-phospho-beta-glucosidase/beta-galactosidase
MYNVWRLPRIQCCQDGLISNVNQEGINYYNTLIDGLIDAGIKPMVTLFHWDLPSNLENKFGGFLNESISDFFTRRKPLTCRKSLTNIIT